MACAETNLKIYPGDLIMVSCYCLEIGDRSAKKIAIFYKGDLFLCVGSSNSGRGVTTLNLLSVQRPGDFLRSVLNVESFSTMFEKVSE